MPTRLQTPAVGTSDQSQMEVWLLLIGSSIAEKNSEALLKASPIRMYPGNIYRIISFQLSMAWRSISLKIINSHRLTSAFPCCGSLPLQGLV